MDITGFDVGAFGAAIGSIFAAVKSMSSSKSNELKTKQIEEARAESKLKRDEEFQFMKTSLALHEKEIEHLSQRLDEGNNRFERLENKLDDVVKKQSDTNGLLRELIGKIDGRN